MSTLTEGVYLPDFLVWEEDLNYSREKITILAGSGSARALTAGMVLAKVAKGTATAAAAAHNTGGGTCTTNPTVLAAAKVGVYVAECVKVVGNGGIFKVTDPDGCHVGYATAGNEFSTHLTFTIADSGTDFIVGDAFTITVAAGSGKWVQYDDTGLLGSEDAAGVLVADASAPNGSDAYGVAIVRNAIILASKLTWPAGADSGEKAAALAQLKALGIIEATAG